MAGAPGGSTTTLRRSISYDEAKARLAQLQAQDDASINPVCRTYAYDHGGQMDWALVYLHGYTNCPAQFFQLGKAFGERGYNVIVPRLPYHGLADRMTQAPARLTEAELIQLTLAVVQIAQGMGRQVAISGLSGGGAMAAWAAQNCPDVDQAVVVAPSLGLPFVPIPVSQFGKFLVQHLPNFFIWWDPRVKEKIEGTPHAYPRFSTRGLGEFMRLGTRVLKQAQSRAPLAADIVVITSAADTAVNNLLVYRLADAWRAHAPDRVRSYEFPKDENIFHDMIDPTQPRQRTEIVYPMWLTLVAGQEAAAPLSPVVDPAQSAANAAQQLLDAMMAELLQWFAGLAEIELGPYHHASLVVTAIGASVLGGTLGASFQRSLNLTQDEIARIGAELDAGKVAVVVTCEDFEIPMLTELFGAIHGTVRAYQALAEALAETAATMEEPAVAAAREDAGVEATTGVN